MKILLVLAAACALSRSARAEDCEASARTPWLTAGKGCIAEATAHGASCAKAKVVLALRGPGNEQRFKESAGAARA